MLSSFTKPIRSEIDGRISYLIGIYGFDYLKCEKQSSNYWASKKKPGIYGQGLLKSEQDPFKPARIGMLGEIAFSKLVERKANLDYQHYGDNQDFMIDGQKYDIKIITNKSENCLIYYKNYAGKIIPLDKDFYVFGRLLGENRFRCYAEIEMFGFFTKETILSTFKIEKSPFKKATHLNYAGELRNSSPLRKLPCLAS